MSSTDSKRVCMYALDRMVHKHMLGESGSCSTVAYTNAVSSLSSKVNGVEAMRILNDELHHPSVEHVVRDNRIEFWIR